MITNMAIKQLSIFLENRKGAAMEATGVLSSAHINIRAMCLADTADFGVLRLIVDDIDKARAALSGAGMTVIETDVVAVSVSDDPGGFYQALVSLWGGGVAVEYSYAFVAPVGVGATVILRCDDNAKAEDTLRENGFLLLTQDQVSL